MNGFNAYGIDIQLDSSVKSLSRVAAMCISGTIQNGIFLTQNESPRIRIYKNKITFGKCYNPMYQGISGNIAPNFFLEYGNLVYYFSDSYKCSFWDKQLDYKGAFAPSVPDNEQIFNLIYPKFA